jgi:hypothetical protein
LFLVHGGLWEDIGAEWFWARTGVVAGLTALGHQMFAPDRPRQAPNWQVEADALAAALPMAGSVTVLAGSNGCSAAVRLALSRPAGLDRLILAWPATAGDPVLDARQREELTGLGASGAVIDELLAGRTLRGVIDAELSSLTIPVAVIPSTVDGPVHRWHTVDTLCRLIPGAVRLPACPEAPRPTFPPQLPGFLASVDGFVRA